MKTEKSIELRRAKTKKQWKQEMKKSRSLAYSGKNTGTIVIPDKKKYNRRNEKKEIQKLIEG